MPNFVLAYVSYVCIAMSSDAMQDGMKLPCECKGNQISGGRQSQNKLMVVAIRPP